MIKLKEGLFGRAIEKKRKRRRNDDDGRDDERCDRTSNRNSLEARGSPHARCGEKSDEACGPVGNQVVGCS